MSRCSLTCISRALWLLGISPHLSLREWFEMKPISWTRDRLRALFPPQHSWK